MKKLIASILIVLLMIPTVAFAESTHTLSELDLTASGHSDKTLEHDGYTWDAANAVLTLKDISVGGRLSCPSGTAPSTSRVPAMRALSTEMIPAQPKAPPSTARTGPSCGLKSKCPAR